ncbi:MAG: class I SAM-dependent methyltransferase [Actinomycetota bacterium]|nr:class I SAM-dependent methyltransferase [Actinomycetota bacterium]
MHACTIIAKNYVAFARVLARSFGEHHPDGAFSVLVIDDFTGFIDPTTEPFELITPEAIGCEEFDQMACRYDVLQLSTAVKPWLLRHLLARGASTITYLDPDIRVCAPLTELERLGREHSLVLTPHNTKPIPFDGERPSQVDIMISGVFNLGYVTMGQGEQSQRLLDWWSQRLIRDCRVDPVLGYFVDQRWIDLVPGWLDDFAIVRRPEFNVAYWNLHDRDLQHDGERYTVNGSPLGFFHFSGFDPDRPTALSRHQTRVRLDERPALARICGEYADALLASDHGRARQWPYGYGTLPDGTRFGPLLRRLFDVGEEHGALARSPLTGVGYEDFLAWLGAQDEGAPAGITRALAGLYEQRPDLRRAFPDVAERDRERYLNWVREKGVLDGGLPESLVSPPPSDPVLGDPLPSTSGLAAVEERMRRGPIPRWPNSRARKLAHRALLRAIRPYTAYRSALDSELLESLRRLSRAQDERLQQDAQAQARVEELGAGVAQMLALRQPIVDRLDGLSAELLRIQAERQALPYMEGAPFTVRRDPVAGTVLGYDEDPGSTQEGRYRSFEDVFRGSEEMIRERQRRYLPIIGERQPVLDFGCGRGELLDLLRKQGIPYTGVDSDESMVARCHEKGHAEVVHGDGLEFLEALPTGSLGAIFAAQVIEHMTEAQLRRMLSLAREKLAKDGLLIAETVNPHSAPALKAFWVDLTHQQPIFPEVALELCREAGFRSAYVFHPNGTGDVERDRFVEGEFAVVASPGAPAG